MNDSLETLNKCMKLPFWRGLAIQMFVLGQVHYHTKLAHEDARQEEIVQILVDSHTRDYKITAEEVEQAFKDCLEDNMITTTDDKIYDLTKGGQKLVNYIVRGRDGTNESDI